MLLSLIQPEILPEKPEWFSEKSIHNFTDCDNPPNIEGTRVQNLRSNTIVRRFRQKHLFPYS